MSVVVLSALEAELDLIHGHLTGTGYDRVGPWDIRTGRIGNSEVVLAQSGLGKVNTASLSALLWERFRPSLVVFTGVAGGLDPDLGVGDVVVGEKTVQHDAGVAANEGIRRYQAGHIPFFNPTDQFGFRPAPDLLETVRQIAGSTTLTPVMGRKPSIVFGTIATGDVFVQDEVTRRLLHTELGAVAVEMEGGALGQTATALGFDHLVVRAVSDLADDGADHDFGQFVGEVAANSARLVLTLLDRLENHDRDLPLGS